MPKNRLFEISIEGTSGGVKTQMILTPVQIKSMLELRNKINTQEGSDLLMQMWRLDDAEAEVYIDALKEE